jgi:hypothetical protein
MFTTVNKLPQAYLLLVPEKIAKPKMDQELLQCFHALKVHIRSNKNSSFGLEWTALTFKLTHVSFNHGAFTCTWVLSN